MRLATRAASWTSITRRGRAGRPSSRVRCSAPRLLLSDDQLQALGESDSQLSATLRRAPDRSQNLDDLSAVPGVTPQVLQVLKQECYPGAFTIRNVEIVGPQIGADLRQQAMLVVLVRARGDACLYRLPL